jgi:hypothetical protein
MLFYYTLSIALIACQCIVILQKIHLSCAECQFCFSSQKEVGQRVVMPSFKFLIVMLSAFVLNIFMLIVIVLSHYGDCHYAEYTYPELYYAEFLYGEHRYAESNHAD